MTIFFILSLVAILSSVLLITNQNPVYLVLSLVLLFVTGSIILLMLGVDFLPFLFMLVYLGVVSILFLILGNKKVKWNDPFTHYCLCFGLLFLFALSWPFFYGGNSIFSLAGLILNLLGFYLVISMEYPKTLHAFGETRRKLSLSQKLKVGGYLLIVGILAYIIRCYFFPFLSSFLTFVSNHPLVYLSILFFFCLFIAIGISYYIKKHYHKTQGQNVMLVVLQKVFNNSRFLKKISLFFRQHPDDKNLFVWYLAAISAVNNSPLILLFFFSLRYHNGLEAYVWMLLVLATTFMVTLPCFREYFFGKYGKNSLRLIGWNGPELPFFRLAVGAVGARAIWATAELANEETKRINKIRDFQHRQEMADNINRRREEFRKLDPQNSQKYPYVSSMDIDNSGNLNSVGLDKIKGLPAGEDKVNLPPKN